MKAKVFNKVTQTEQYISRKILNSPIGQRNFELISDGHPDDADLYDPNKTYPAPVKQVDTNELLKKQLQEIELLKAQLAASQKKQQEPQESESSSEKPEPKAPKKTKANSSSAPAVEV